MANMRLSRNDIESISAHFSNGKLMHFKKGETIIHGTIEPDGVYLVLEGYVKAYSVSPLGQINLLLIHGENEILPLPWALDGPQKLGIFYEALSKVTALKTSKHDLRKAMGSDQWLTEQILRQFVNTFTVYAQRIQSLGYRLPRERVISSLLDLATRFGAVHTQGIVIKAPVTHQDISDSISMTRETASKALELLFKDKLLYQKNHLFIIRDEQKLKDELL
ncbi:MAG: Crp/Fnr family transcriptional regulator [bacterium]|nr:Crp/Fnr family transcriptional regulator [bacterium]